MTFDEFISKWSGKGCDFDGSYGNQCVDLYRTYVKEVIGCKQSPGVTGAADIWDTYNQNCFTRVENSPTGVPPKGSIVIWGRTYGPYGHVAIAVEGTTSSFKAFSQNDPAGQLPIVKTYRSYKGVLGWLIPKGSMQSDEIAVKKSDFEKLVAKSSSLDEILAKYSVADAQGIYNMVAGKDARLTDLGNQLGKSQAEMTNREEQVSRLTDQLVICQTDKTTLQTRLNEMEKNYTTAAKDNGLKNIEIAQLKTQLETAKQGEFRLSIAELVKMIWNQKIVITRG